MKYLFDSTGAHIANEVNGRLHAPSGQNIGHFMPAYGFFIDMSGRYLGEIYKEDRLLHRVNNGYENMSFGSYGNYGNIGNYGNPGNHGNIGNNGTHRDIEKDKLA